MIGLFASNIRSNLQSHLSMEYVSFEWVSRVLSQLFVSSSIETSRYVKGIMQSARQWNGWRRPTREYLWKIGKGNPIIASGWGLKKIFLSWSFAIKNMTYHYFEIYRHWKYVWFTALLKFWYPVQLPNEGQGLLSIKRKLERRCFTAPIPQTLACNWNFSFLLVTIVY